MIIVKLLDKNLVFRTLTIRDYGLVCQNKINLMMLWGQGKYRAGTVG